ncbi:MAG: cobalt-precorrin-5B (C(1))-methyltransferase CbiD [Lachnospiraceae bacterium]|nr:cobalt-precorrin-5B (C(1))-methyltransferase CbiD [Lachnospiraceae bacterium]
MNYGFTTGSCAAAAAKAAIYMLLSGNIKKSIKIDTPAGITYTPDILDIKVNEDNCSCGVKKYSGDDPDITNNAYIYARVEIIRDNMGNIHIDGGPGVGRVTRPGLDQPVGNAAINSVPRSMIDKEVRQVMELYDCRDSVNVIIYVPEGEELAEKTFNKRLGILGGISIIGTTGIVEPMSTRAILETIKVELSQKKAEGYENIVISPGNYGMNFMKEKYGYDLEKAVKCSNYIGPAIDMASEAGFKKVLLVGHIGKLIKVSGGIMNTHSAEGDCRMELMAAAAIRSGGSKESLKAVLNCVSTEEAYEILYKEGIAGKCMEYIMERISYYLNKRAKGIIKVECITYSNQWGLLGKTENAEELLRS